MENPKDDGKTIPLNGDWKEEWRKYGDKYEYPFLSSKCFGWPLTSIKDSSDVETRIVTPLIGLLRGERK